MKKITDKFKIQQTHEQLPKIRRAPETVLTSIQSTNAGAQVICHKLPEGLNWTQKLEEISRICLAHPQGKELSILYRLLGLRNFLIHAPKPMAA
ncbi:hypothetical protein Lepto7375DRAFT_6757 [Leptolyngbya sp. PCC 7375]|nr:hypothetical protein Lepto7375DRAFT_6757 [Leptolyngbya sp. PCC 7375]